MLDYINKKERERDGWTEGLSLSLSLSLSLFFLFIQSNISYNCNGLYFAG